MFPVKRKREEDHQNPYLSKKQHGKDYLTLEKQLPDLQARKEFLKQKMDEWYNNKRTQITGDTTLSSEEKTAQLTALDFDYFKEEKVEFLETTNEEFVKDFIDWLQYKDPDSPRNPKYVRHKEAELGKYGATVRREALNLTGQKEWLNGFVYKKDALKRKLAVLYGGPNKWFNWNLYHGWLFYKYVLRGVDGTNEKMFLSDIQDLYDFENRVDRPADKRQKRGQEHTNPLAELEDDDKRRHRKPGDPQGPKKEEDGSDMDDNQPEKDDEREESVSDKLDKMIELMEKQQQQKSPRKDGAASEMAAKMDNALGMFANTVAAIDGTLNLLVQKMDVQMDSPSPQPSAPPLEDLDLPEFQPLPSPPPPPAAAAVAEPPAAVVSTPAPAAVAEGGKQHSASKPTIASINKMTSGAAATTAAINTMSNDEFRTAVENNWLTKDILKEYAASPDAAASKRQILTPELLRDYAEFTKARRKGQPKSKPRLPVNEPDTPIKRHTKAKTKAKKKKQST